MRVLGTFPTRDAADAVRDAFIKDGFRPEDLIVMANRMAQEPPEDADLEVGTAGEGGFGEFQEKIGKAVMQIMHKENPLMGDGTEGEPTSGALLGVTVTTEADADKVKQMLTERYFAADVEIAEAD